RLLEYDDVMNAQREVIYKRRKHALQGDRLKVDIANMLFETCEDIVMNNKATNDFKNFEFQIISTFSITAPVLEDEFEQMTEGALIDKLYQTTFDYYKQKGEINATLTYPVIKNVFERPGNAFEKIVVPFTDGNKTLNVVTELQKAYDTKGKHLIEDFERNITLALIDEAWKNHLRKMDELKQSVQLAVHEQKDPLLIYKFEAFELFKLMIANLNREVISFLLKGSIPSQDTSIQEAKQRRRKDNLKTTKDDVLNTEELAAKQRAIGAGASAPQRQTVETITREMPKIGRNDRVSIKNTVTGENKSLKFKQAEPLIKSGQWVLVEKK
ncbi:MAG: preprotein translocase subunit SecA, partial [Flavobacteriaceae bacterium]